jgi:hypothetical protein
LAAQFLAMSFGDKIVFIPFGARIVECFTSTCCCVEIPSDMSGCATDATVKWEQTTVDTLGKIFNEFWIKNIKFFIRSSWVSIFQSLLEWTEIAIFCLKKSEKLLIERV